MATNTDKMLEALFSQLEKVGKAVGVEIANPYASSATLNQAADDFWGPGGAGYARKNGLPMPKSEVPKAEEEDGEKDENENDKGSGNGSGGGEHDTDQIGSGQGLPPGPLSFAPVTPNNMILPKPAAPPKRRATRRGNSAAKK